MRPTLFAALFLLVCGCSRELEEERLESMENRLQATEFQMAGLAEMEPRLQAALRTMQEQYREWANRIESSHERIARLETRLLNIEQRLEQTEEWIREKEQEEEKETVYATPDGQVPEAWKQLAEKCQLHMAGQAQTTLNFLVRIDRYMSEFPVQQPVELEKDDPLVCMTSNLARDSRPLQAAYRDRELAILKSRDQWLGYRIDRSWQERPERGECNTACCKLDREGRWNCAWGWDGGRWECEYDVEGWRNYNRRWHRTCSYIEDTRDFYDKPYLMQKMEEKEVAIPEALYCVVDLVWENRIYCLSHSQYPVLQIRLPQDPENPGPKPLLPRFSVITIRNWDVVYKDEWTSTWIVKGVYEPQFEGQVAGLAIEVVQEPECCAATNPDGVLAVERALACIPDAQREQRLPGLVAQHGFEDVLHFETERLGVIADPARQDQLTAIRNAGCEQ